MNRIYIFGVGKGKEVLKSHVQPQNVQIIGYIDNRASEYGNGVDGLPVLSPENIEDSYDFIVISVMKYKNIETQLLEMGIDGARIIRFFSPEDAVNPNYWEVFERNGWRIETLSYDYTAKMIPYMENLPYELADSSSGDEIQIPTILPAEMAVQKIMAEQVSLARYGDGEFELMQMRNRSKFQSTDADLARRLREILVSRDDKIIIAIARNYGSLAEYTEDDAYGIRHYLTKAVRSEHMKLLDLDKTYYDAYLSRPYIIYRDKTGAAEKFAGLKSIWESRDILIVEGEKSRIGVGNNLFDNVSSLRRIIAPSSDSYKKYSAILDSVLRNGKDKLILISLGAAATVLAYDLTQLGYWALDIGQIDLEYEWYTRGVTERRDIPYKYVNEVNGGDIVVNLADFGIDEGEYESQIIEWIL